MPTVRTAYAAVLVINLYGFFAPGALISHLLHYLKGLLERPQHRAAERCLRQERTSGKGVAALAATPDSCAGPSYSVPSALGAVIRSLALFFRIGHELS